MTPNSDNAMARFLFAILKQKNLKDIDWNQVASDPVLLEPITNGHAARMRYSRFRATVSGQPSKRRVSGEKPRVSKPKKGSAKKEKKLVKSESTPSLSSYAQFSPASTSITSPYISETQDDFNTRFLTPCSDDMTQGLVVHPAALEDARLQNVPLFPQPTAPPTF
ncbi:hypothetical protein PT974_02458 [Cladobotryum mycophilum]|uniref:Myb-like DNA-binding domain-containing protein n=1 Tax=Cladobotryum mycophilum TaxID=491253 RepID=A0ABR0SY52_9HYPO